MYDILIRNGTLFDGAGLQGVVRDLAIEGDRISMIGHTVTGAARKAIDAEGLAVAPGFIDIKTHSDFTLPIYPKAESKVRHGVQVGEPVIRVAYSSQYAVSASPNCFLIDRNWCVGLDRREAERKQQKLEATTPRRQAKIEQQDQWRRRKKTIEKLKQLGAITPASNKKASAVRGEREIELLKVLY